MSDRSRKSLASKTNLLLRHIISTFNAKLGIIWLARTDSFYTSTQEGGHKFVDTNSMVSFLAGYYYSFLKHRNKLSPIVIENLGVTPKIPENLLKLAEIENITSLLISPILLKKQIKGTLILGAGDNRNFSNINFDLLRLLTDSALRLNESSNSTSTRHEKEEPDNFLDSMIGKSAVMQEIYKTILKVAPSNSNIFIYGESGTGKELVARTIHAHSQRKTQAFIPVDCVSLPESLLESELFGYEKGAFTGATSIKRGLMEYSHKGTFFLDEITEINVELQAKLLHVLQERQFRRVGGQKLIDLDIRIISSTNIDPKDAMVQGKLREDLFYRLNVIPVYLTPLRERKEDIPLLVEGFIKHFSKSYEGKKFEMSEEALHCLINYKWPGNVRELKNLVERLISLSKSEMISLRDLPVAIVNDSSSTQSDLNNSYKTLPYIKAKEKSLIKFERLYFSRLIDKCNGNITKVANEAKVSRKTVYNILEKQGLKRFQLIGRPLWRDKSKAIEKSEFVQLEI